MCGAELAAIASLNSGLILYDERIFVHDVTGSLLSSEELAYILPQMFGTRRLLEIKRSLPFRLIFQSGHSTKLLRRWRLAL